MITVMNGKWSTKDALEDICSTRPSHVFIDGTVVRTGEPFSGYVSSIPYGDTIRVLHHGKEYGFEKRTNNTIKVM